MFDLITGQAKHIPGGGAGPIAVSTALHLLTLAAVVTVPLLFMREVLPSVPTMMAFVVSAPAPPPPPPPPPVPAAKEEVRRASNAPVSASPAAAPVEAPSRVIEELPVPAAEEGVAGGVEGGIPGGIAGGVVGGLPEAPPPPPPPPPMAPTSPVRIGGQIQAPTLISRVEPVYPNVAVAARMQGVVILEATVDAEGRVTDLKVLRGMPVLDRAAMDAVKQWRYSPVILNGRPVSFILTVVVSFSLPDPKQPAGARY